MTVKGILTKVASNLRFLGISSKCPESGEQLLDTFVFLDPSIAIPAFGGSFGNFVEGLETGEFVTLCSFEAFLAHLRCIQGSFSLGEFSQYVSFLQVEYYPTLKNRPIFQWIVRSSFRKWEQVAPCTLESTCVWNRPLFVWNRNNKKPVKFRCRRQYWEAFSEHKKSRNDAGTMVLKKKRFSSFASTPLVWQTPSFAIFHYIPEISDHMNKKS